ncbi:MAG TPA: hypothetical protein VFR81_10720, partial [Longimicrobium sp.]|nr:hypothetical protein [Longimicrobium sp.]
VDEAGVVRLLDLAAAAPLWERQLDQAPARTFVGPLDRRYRVALSDDGTVVAIGSAEGLVVLSGADGRILRRDTVATPALALSADGRLLARLDGDDGLSVQRTADGRTVARLDRRGVAGVRDLVFSPGGRRLMAIGGTSFGTFLGTRHFVEEHLVVWELESGRVELRLPDSRIDADDYQTSIGARADERRQLSGLVWNPLSREAAGILYPSMLAYWTVPSGMVPGRLTAWRLTDDGLVETYRGGARNDLTTLGFAASGGALLVGGEDGYTRVIDLSRARLLGESCRAVRRDWTESERRRHLGAGWRRPARCGGRGLPADSADLDAPGPPGARASLASPSSNPRLR